VKDSFLRAAGKKNFAGQVDDEYNIRGALDERLEVFLTLFELLLKPFVLADVARNDRDCRSRSGVVVHG
jgi:hypothetical protein